MDERRNNKKKIKKKYSHTNITVVRERKKEDNKIIYTCTESNGYILKK